MNFILQLKCSIAYSSLSLFVDPKSEHARQFDEDAEVSECKSSEDQNIRQPPCDLLQGRRPQVTASSRIAMTDTTSAFTATSAFSIAGVFGALAFAYFGLAKLLPKTASRTDKFTFVWLVSYLNFELL
jgi:hypothetical protein